jgi:signal transduction histidine kinase
LDQTHEGQGIGLAVVHEIIQAYEIGLVFGQSSSLGGLSVELTLAMSE